LSRGAILLRRRAIWETQVSLAMESLGWFAMKMDWRQFLACGELGCFVLAWVLGMVVALSEFRGREGSRPGNDVAASNGAVSEFELLE